MFSELSMIRSLKFRNFVNVERVLFNEGINNDRISLKVIRGLTDDTEQLSWVLCACPQIYI